MKKLLTLTLAVLIVLALCIPAFAAGSVVVPLNTPNDGPDDDSDKPISPILALSDSDTALLNDNVQEITGSRVYVRADASASSAKIGSLNKGDTVVVIEIVDGWAKILWNGSVAYVSASFISQPAAQVIVNGGVAKFEEKVD